MLLITMSLVILELSGYHWDGGLTHRTRYAQYLTAFCTVIRYDYLVDSDSINLLH